MTVEAIAHALNLRRSGDDYVGRCPCCGYKSGFAIRDGDDGKLLTICHTGKCDWTAIRGALVKLGLLNDDREPQRRRRKATRIIRPAPSAPKTDADIAALDNWQAAARIYHRGIPAAGTPVERYLRVARDYTGPIPDVLRFVPDLWHRESNTRWPAMIGLVEHDVFGHIAIHRSWLQPDGSAKAPVSPDRMTLGPADGGAIRLAPIGPNGELALAEGVEDALSFMKLTGQPCWSCLTAGGIESFVLPAAVRFVAIAPDNDKRGRAAAQNAARRFIAEGRRVWIAKPPIGKDWSDTLRAKARETAA